MGVGYLVSRCHTGIESSSYVPRIIIRPPMVESMVYPNSPWFFPGRNPAKPVSKDALSHALRKLALAGAKKLTSHGMRAFRVLVRRSHGIDDGIIAYELGQSSGAQIIVETYGGYPANWKNGGGPMLSWIPKVNAWTDRTKEGWKLVTDAKKPSTDGAS